MGKAKRAARGSKSNRDASPGRRSKTPGVSHRTINSVLVQTAFSMPDQRQKWIPKYEMELGLRPMRHDATSEVIEARCMFCETFGREDVTVQRNTEFSSLLKQKQRKKSANIKTFTRFRRDNVVSHLTKQHPIQWGIFNDLPLEDD